MPVFLMGVLAGMATGVLSGFGVGGGTLLILYLTFFQGYEQVMAQGINLLYFFPTSASALVEHFRRRDMPLTDVILPAAVGGCLTAAFAAWITGQMDMGLLRRLFGGYLLVLGIMELFRKKKPEKEKRK